MIVAMAMAAMLTAMGGAVAQAGSDDPGQRIEDRLDARGDRIDARLDRRGESIHNRYDRRHP